MDDRIFCMNLLFMSEAIHKVLRHVLTYKNYWSNLEYESCMFPILMLKGLLSHWDSLSGMFGMTKELLYCILTDSPGSSVHPSHFWNQRFLAMSEIEPPWIANENLELYHLRFHLRSRARQLGSASTNSKSDSMSTGQKTC